MSRIIAGVFKDFNKAKEAVVEIEKEGITSVDNISLVTQMEEEDDEESHPLQLEGQKQGVIQKAGEAVMGLLNSVATVIVPGVGAVLAAGPLITTRGIEGGVLGALGGGLMMAMINCGFPEEQAQIYEERVRNGETFVSFIMDTSDHDAVGILTKYGVEEVGVVG